MNIDEYIKANSDNLTIEVLCEKFDVSIPTVYRHLQMNGAKVKKDKNLQRTEEMKKIVDLIEIFSQKLIAQMTSRPWIFKVLSCCAMKSEIS